MKTEKVLMSATIIFPVRDGKVCLAIKGRHIGEGCWNGYGGGIEAGETVVDSAIRELSDESHVSTRSDNYDKVAIVDFHNTKSDGTKFICRCHVFLVKDWSGEFTETEEMLRPSWFEVNNLPLDKMMLADKFWVPLILKGKKLVVEAHYGPFQKTLLGDVKIKEVSSFEDENTV